MNLQGSDIFGEQTSHRPLASLQGESPSAGGVAHVSLPLQYREALQRQQRESYQERVKRSARMAPGLNNEGLKLTQRAAEPEDPPTPEEELKGSESLENEASDELNMNIAAKDNLEAIDPTPAENDEGPLVRPAREQNLSFGPVTEPPEPQFFEAPVPQPLPQDTFTIPTPTAVPMAVPAPIPGENISAALRTKEKPEEQYPVHFLLKLERIVSMSMPEQKLLLTSPLPKYAGVVHCRVIRHNEGLSGRWFPKYELRLAGTDRLLLTGKRRPGNWTGNYLLTVDHDNLTTKSPGYIGKLRSNFWGTEYRLYDDGDNPATVPSTQKPREHLGVVMYESRWFQKRGPRKMTVLLPKVVQGDAHLQCIPRTEKESLVALYESHSLDKLLVFKNRQPKWNDILKAHILDFKGRVKRPSVKNFILTDEHGKEDYIVFGRSEENSFILDVKWPLCLYQAFALGIASIANKYGCQ